MITKVIIKFSQEEKDILKKHKITQKSMRRRLSMYADNEMHELFDEAKKQDEYN